jgi:ABC-type transporter Mla MlaB component
MPLELGATAVLTGTVTVEEAEPLASWLRDHHSAQIDLSRCTHLHTAALQALLSARPTIAAEPADAFLARWILPLLRHNPTQVTKS